MGLNFAYIYIPFYCLLGGLKTFIPERMDPFQFVTLEQLKLLISNSNYKLNMRERLTFNSGRL